MVFPRWFPRWSPDAGSQYHRGFVRPSDSIHPKQGIAQLPARWLVYGRASSNYTDTNGTKPATAQQSHTITYMCTWSN